MSPAIQPKGWCPGALRPMLSGDGWLVRLRISGGVVSAAAARAIADCAKRYGNGLLDLSARANLQMRGVREASLPALVEALQAHGLIDESAEAESVRNVLASPLAGLSPDAAFDIRPYVRALEQRLVSDAALQGLPSKFGFMVDDGGGLSLSGVGADIRFVASHGPRFMVSLAGCDEAAVIESIELPDVAVRLALAFIDQAHHCETPPRRMGALIAMRGAAGLWRAAGLAPTHQTPRAAAPPEPLGHHTLVAQGFLGLGLAFGRLSAGDLAWLADMAQAHGVGELRLTPWRAILLPGVDAHAARLILSQASDHFITDPTDARLAVIACAGAPACASAQAPTQDHALSLASLARALSPSGVTLHVSGCAKGCARPHATAMTLVARAGLYDLITQGRASDAPSQQGLDLTACRAALRAMTATEGARL